LIGGIFHSQLAQGKTFAGNVGNQVDHLADLDGGALQFLIFTLMATSPLIAF